MHDASGLILLPNRGTRILEKISVFNNRIGENYSAGQVLQTQLDTSIWEYQSSEFEFLPEQPEITYLHPEDSTKFYSTGLSSMQVLPNGNILMLAGRFGYAIELNTNQELLWEYKIPILAGDPIEQGTTLTVNNNITFRMDRYPLDYPGFENRELQPINFLELSPSPIMECAITSSEDSNTNAVSIFPNPASDHVFYCF